MKPQNNTLYAIIFLSIAAATYLLTAFIPSFNYALGPVRELMYIGVGLVKGPGFVEIIKTVLPKGDGRE